MRPSSGVLWASPQSLAFCSHRCGGIEKLELSSLGESGAVVEQLIVIAGRLSAPAEKLELLWRAS
jgi:hypothetical protein